MNDKKRLKVYPHLNFHKKCFFLVNLLVFTAVFSSYVHAKESLVLGLYEGHPFGWEDERGDYQGITLGHMQYLVDKVDPSIATDVFMGNTQRLVFGVLNGKVDLYIGGGDQRFLSGAVSLGHLMDVSVEVWRVKSETPALDDPLSGVVALREVFFNLAEARHHHIQRAPYSEYSLKMLKANRVDAVVANSMELCYYALRMGYSIDDFDRYTFMTIPVAAWTNKASVIMEDIQAWQQAVKDLERELPDNLADDYCRSYD